MNAFELNYFLWYNLAPIIIIFLFIILAYCYWKILIQSEEVKIERERLILEKERQKESMQQALQTYERESTRFNETERKLQEILKRVEQENQTLSARTKKCLAEIEDKRKHLREQSRPDENRYQYPSRPSRSTEFGNKNNDDHTLENIGEIVKIVGSVAMMILAGRSFFR